jgi:phosphoribosylformylglycinamidine cyclo-ligase
MSVGDKGKDFYRSSGVDIDKGDHLVDWLQADKSSKNHRYGSVISGIGGFAALFRPNFKDFVDPLIISCTDGVGTKLLLSIENDALEGCGVDLVAMCVNDLYCLGGRPLFFLDYYATGVLNERQFQQIITGIRKGLAQSECLLLGGETAELPGLYQHGHLDLAGFVVGVVDQPKMLGPHLVCEGDLIYGLRSSGFHSNGYSLVRKWLTPELKQKYLPKVLEPTSIYSELPMLVDRLGNSVIHAAANITGGGISGNVSRVIGDGLCATIDAERLETPTWMVEYIKFHTPDPLDLESTFNLGLGMALIIDSKSAKVFESTAKELSGRMYGPIGRVIRSKTEEKVIYQSFK